jgi:hypothetical protein
MMTWLFIISLPVLTYVFGRLIFAFQFRKQVKVLFSLSKRISNQQFNKAQLVGLPEPVQRYFNHVFKDKQAYISYVRIRHDGQFKSDINKKWTPIRGEQYFTTEKPGYIWKGETSMFTARDSYIANEGRLIVTLFSLLNVVYGQGKEFDEGEFQRWLSESVWFPTNLLPSEHLKWTEIDNHSAKLSFHYNELAVEFEVTFNPKGEIVQMETKRFMQKGSKETWIVKFADYKKMNGVFIPTRNEAFWRLEGKDLCYAQFNLLDIEYNVASRYSSE